MGTATNESQLVKAMEKRIKARCPKAVVWKIVGSPYQEPGIPDLLVILQGRVLALEAKFQRAGESDEHVLSRVSPRQWKQIERVRAAGGVAEVVWTVEHLEKILDKFLE